MKFECLIDGKEFPDEKKLHSYVSKTLKVKLEDYYKQYYPRIDFHTLEPIEFKNKEFYMSSFFNTRQNLVKYFKENPKNVELVSNVLRLRKEAKSLKFAPSTVEARTSILPTPLMAKTFGWNYNEICEEIGLETRYDYEDVLEYETSRRLSVLRDTREQKPLDFKGEVVVSKLDFGDYVCASHYRKVFVERKSLVDLCGTLSQGFERFQREIERAGEMESYLVVCVEELLTAVESLGSTPHTKKIKATPEFIYSRMRALCQQYDNVQFLFVSGRSEMAGTLEKIFRLNNDIRGVDLQYYYDSKLL